MKIFLSKYYPGIILIFLVLLWVFAFGTILSLSIKWEKEHHEYNCGFCRQHE